MKQYKWQLGNIHCTSCAHIIQGYMKEQGIEEAQVNVLSKTMIFTAEDVQLSSLKKGLEDLGYRVKKEKTQQKVTTDLHHSSNFMGNKEAIIFYISWLLTLPLLLHMFLNVPLLHDPLVQLLLSTPVYLLGWVQFGRGAIKSVLYKRPNMDVLIIVGATAAYVYSLVGVFILQDSKYMFFETSAAIFSIVMLGNKLEHWAVSRTRRALEKLLVQESSMANMIVFGEHREEQVLRVESAQLRVGDLILIRSGEKVPTDAKILWGSGQVSEAVISGESMPIYKKEDDALLGGSVVMEGNIKAMVTAEERESTMGKIIAYIEKVERTKPPIQITADKISAIFVPTVIVLALFTFALNTSMFHQSVSESLMRSVAVLVISCPCALGLAAPVAISIGLGMAYRRGVLFKDAHNFEMFKSIKQVAFDKTGTLTTGVLRIRGYHYEHITEEDFKKILLALEAYSTHPIAQTLKEAWGNQSVGITFDKVREMKGIGMEAKDAEGNTFVAGSFKILPPSLQETNPKSLYLLKNEQLIGWVDFQDMLRPEASLVITYLKSHNIQVHLISGDSKAKCEEMAQSLGITSVYAEQKPDEKMTLVGQLNALAPLAMVGDGINDAPALAAATVGVSMRGATQIAIQTAHLVLLQSSLKELPFALSIGRHTLHTIKSNFLWALSYNVIAIPCAAMGLMAPIYAALFMWLSDVVLVLNSMRLYWKKVD